MFNPEIRKFYDDSSGIASLASQGTGGLLQGITGFFQKKQGNAILKQNPYPNMPIPAEELANQQQAQRMADEGTPSAQYLQSQKNIQRQQAAALQSSQDRRMGGALIGGIQEGTNDAMGNLDARSAAARRENQLNLQNVNNQVSGYRDKAWDWNVKNKYLQNYQLGQSLIGSGNANMYGGADKLLGAGAQAYGSGLFSGGGSPSGGNSGSSAGSSIGSLVGQIAPMLLI